MGSRTTDKKRRQKLRKKLLALGVPADRVERRVAALGKQQQSARHVAAQWIELRARAAAQEAELDAAYAPPDRPVFEPDDSGYRPARPDKLRVGPARVTAVTAKAAARRKAMTKYEYEAAERRVDGRAS